MKKFFVLGVLFVLPIVAYLFFATGVNNFAKLPVLTKNINLPTQFTTIQETQVSLQGKIAIVGFLGNTIQDKKAQLFNLNQKIYKRFHEFSDFQFVMFITEDSKDEALKICDELKTLTDISKWFFVVESENAIQSFYNKLEVSPSLDNDLSTPLVFILDKEGSLRGRRGDDELLYGYNATSVAEINNKMI